MSNKKIVRREVKCGAISNTFLSNVDPVLRSIYLARGVQSEKELDYRFEYLLPFHDLLDVQLAADLLFKALRTQKKILIVGDYDVDGATSTALMVKGLRRLGFQQVDFLIPNRFTYGYGLSPKMIELAMLRNPDVLITVDNGIASIEGVEEATKHHIEVIITDHHVPGPVLPKASAIINPKRKDDPFLSKNLSGVGVSFYLLIALRARLRQDRWFEEYGIQEPHLASYLDLIALGTVADVVPLDYNNRMLVHQGLKRIREGKMCAGIKALLKVSEKDFSQVNAETLSYVIAPKLNSAGRLDDMSLGVHCLLAENDHDAERYARQLNRFNQERKLIERSMQREAMGILERLNRERHYQHLEEMPFGLCLMDENWHEGVIGIIASRLREAYHRPVIIFAPQEGGMLKGSARSISKVSMYELLAKIADQNPGLIDHFGGHAMAAGLSLSAQNFHHFSKRFDEHIRQALSSKDLEEILMSDGELTDEHIHLDFAKLLRDAGPWGEGFSEPLFEGIFEMVRQEVVGKDHLKMILKKNARIIDAIAFNVDVNQWPNAKCKKIYALYRLAVNAYKGKESVQLMIQYFEAV